MKTIAKLFLFIAIAGLMACGGHSHGEGGHSHDGDHKHNEDHAHESEKNGLKMNEAGGYGVSVNQENTMTIEQMLAKVNGNESVNGKVKATVHEVCQKKGCWMTLNRADGKTMRVTFKDYGFFVPKDISGKEVIIEGTAKMDVTDVEDLKHFAKDAGKSKAEIDAITEPETEMVFVADGVIIL